MPGTPAPFVKPQYFTNAGLIASGHKLFTYQAGTTTKLVTYTDADLGVQNTNPIILDASGRADIFLLPASYKFVLAPSTDTDPPTSPLWTVDEISAIPETAEGGDVEGIAGEAIAEEDAVYLSDGSGGATAGRWYKASTLQTYRSSKAPMIGWAIADIAVGATGTIRRSGSVHYSSALTPGATYYVGSTAGTITSSEPAAGTPRRVLGVADTISSLVLHGESAKAVIRPRVIASTGAIGNVGVGEDTAYSITIPAAEIHTDGMSLRIHAWGTTANNANVKTIKLKIEGTNVLTFLPTASEAGRWTLDATIIRASATTSRVGSMAAVGPANGPTSRIGTNTATPTTTWANAVPILLTFEGTADNDVTGEGFIVYQFD